MDIETDYKKYEERSNALELGLVRPQPFSTGEIYLDNFNNNSNIDNNEEVNIPLRNVPTRIFNDHKWNNLFKFDIESLCLSTIIPCHVIGKIGEAVHMEYDLLLVAYGLFFVISNVAYYINSNIFRDICPKKETDWCFLEANKTICNNRYMSINGDKVQCEYNSKYNTCFSGASNCIDDVDYTFLVVVGVVLNIISISGMFITHIYLRKIYKEDKKVKFSWFYDIITVIFCGPCSLAQLYREINNHEEQVFDTENTSVQI